MPKMVIALVGPQLAGKSEAICTIAKWCGPENLEHCSTGNIVRKLLTTIGPETGRDKCSKMVEALIEAFGEDVISRGVRRRIEKSCKSVFIFDSMRMDTDEHMVNALQGLQTLTLCVTAKPHIRYQRLQTRRRLGEEILSPKMFLEHEQLPTEVLIRSIGERADVHLENNGTEEEFRATIWGFCQQYLGAFRVDCASKTA